MSISRRALIGGSLALSVCVATAAYLGLGSGESAAPPSAPGTASSTAPAAPAAPVHSSSVAAAPAPAEGSAPGASDEAPFGAPASLIESDPVLMDRARQHELAAAADARWAESVDAGEYSADDVDPSVRGFFSSAQLAPRYAEGGTIEGLVIESVRPDHPLQLAGFMPGDVIHRIQGVDLRDPAEIPALLDRLGPHFDLCATRDGRERCEQIDLQ